MAFPVLHFMWERPRDFVEGREFMNSSSKSAARKYLNHLACALQVVLEFPYDYDYFHTLPGCETLSEQVNFQLNSAIALGEDDLFLKLEELTAQINILETRERFWLAREIAIWLDHHMTYEPTLDQHCYSVNSILPISTEPITIIGSLNNNDEETGICIAPYFRATDLHSRFNVDVLHRSFNRDVLFSANRELSNCRFYPKKKDTAITHCICSSQQFGSSHPGIFRVGFIPITDIPDLLTFNETVVDKDGGPAKERIFGEPRNPQIIETRLRNTLKAIAEMDLDLDLVYCPEMLGTKNMYEIDEDGILPYIDAIANECSSYNGILPRIIVLPSHTQDGNNICYITNGEGLYLGSQKKHKSYVDRREHYREALQEKNITQVSVIHIPGKERIVIMLCADFLETDPESDIHRIVFKHLNPSLVIVPSYTMGEEDFVSALPSIRQYGSSGIWGTCCGSLKTTKPYIGAASIIGTKAIPKMGNACRCGNACGKNDVCLFYIDLPLDVYMGQEEELQFHHITA